MDFSSDANANFEGLLAVNREICMPQVAEKTSSDAPPNCAVVPILFSDENAQADGAGESGNRIMPLRLGLVVLVVVLVVAFRVVAVIVFVVIPLCTQRVEVDFVDDAAQHRRT